MKLLLRAHHLGVEMVLPLVRNPNGPQLESDYVLAFGWQYAFA